MTAATNVLEIPLVAAPQTLAVSLSGTVYNLSLRWNSVSTAWVMDIFDVDLNPLLRGVPLVTGANLLGQFGYLGIPGALFVQSDFDPNAVPTLANLGTNGHLYYVPPATAGSA